MTSSMFDDLFGRPANKVEKGVPWEAKVMEGKYYVPLSQVADLLDQNGALPKVAKGIRARCDRLENQNKTEAKNGD